MITSNDGGAHIKLNFVWIRNWHKSVCALNALSVSAKILKKYVNLSQKQPHQNIAVLWSNFIHNNREKWQGMDVGIIIALMW